MAENQRFRARRTGYPALWILMKYRCTFLDGAQIFSSIENARIIPWSDEPDAYPGGIVFSIAMPGSVPGP
jgi:hypothetical protein